MTDQDRPLDVDGLLRSQEEQLRKAMEAMGAKASTEAEWNQAVADARRAEDEDQRGK